MVFWRDLRIWSVWSLAQGFEKDATDWRVPQLKTYWNLVVRLSWFVGGDWGSIPAKPGKCVNRQNLREFRVLICFYMFLSLKHVETSSTIVLVATPQEAHGLVQAVGSLP